MLDVEIVIGPQEEIEAGLASTLADAAGLIFETPAYRTWVRIRPLAAEHYAENDGGPPAGIRPIFVSVLKARRPAGQAMSLEVQELTEAVARICSRPRESVHIFYEPDAVGRVAFGGELVE